MQSERLKRGYFSVTLSNRESTWPGQQLLKIMITLTKTNDQQNISWDQQLAQLVAQNATFFFYIYVRREGKLSKKTREISQQPNMQSRQSWNKNHLLMQQSNYNHSHIKTQEADTQKQRPTIPQKPTLQVKNPNKSARSRGWKNTLETECNPRNNFTIFS